MLFYSNNKKNGTVTKTELKLNLQIKKKTATGFWSIILCDTEKFYCSVLTQWVSSCFD